MDKIVTLELTAAEVQDILSVLGELPTKSNAWPLAAKIQGMLHAQVQEEGVPPAAPDAVAA
jgi:hypothetical protein